MTSPDSETQPESHLIEQMSLLSPRKLQGIYLCEEPGSQCFQTGHAVLINPPKVFSDPASLLFKELC